jgi:hypothetical protein
MHPHDRRHDHRGSLNLGIIVAARADHHPELLERDECALACCAICNTYVILAPATVRFSGMNPDKPVVCCMCGEVSAAALSAALPGSKMTRQPVPDLASAGMFN